MARTRKKPDLAPSEVSACYQAAVVQVRDSHVDWNEVVHAAPPDRPRILLSGHTIFSIPGPLALAIDRLHGGAAHFHLDVAGGYLENDNGSADVGRYRDVSPEEAERHYLEVSALWSRWDYDLWGDDGE